MDRAAVGTALTLLLVVSAGCNGLLADETGERTPPNRDPYQVPSPTPTPTATQTPTPDPTETVAPGITRDGIESPLNAMSAHGIALYNRSYQVSWSVRVQYSNGTVAENRSIQAWVSSDRTRYLAVRTGFENRGDGRRFAVYADGTRALSARTSGGNQSFGVVAAPGEEIPTPGGILGSDLTFKGRIYRYLSAMNNVSVDAVASGDETQYQVSSSDVSVEEFVALRPGSVENVSILLVVSEEGLVEVAWVVYERVRDGRRLQVFEQIRYTGVGETTVPVPDWLDEARATTDPSSNESEGGSGANGGSDSAVAGVRGEFTRSERAPRLPGRP